MISLVKKINGSFKSKLKSHTPINIAIPKHLTEQIKKIPRMSLAALSENRAKESDWYNLSFRTKIGLDLAKAIYTDEAFVAMEEVFQVCLDMKDRFLLKGIWSVSEDEYQLLKIGLDATDQMCDETTRRIQLEVFKASDLYVKNIIKNSHEKENTIRRSKSLRD